MSQLDFKDCPLSRGLQGCCLCYSKPDWVILHGSGPFLLQTHARCDSHLHDGTSLGDINLTMADFHSLGPDELAELMNRPKELEPEEIGF